MHKKHVITFLLSCFITHAFAQLATKRDYDAAIAIQAGVNTTIALPQTTGEINVKPSLGLKLTFPFNRKWFLGSEIYYTEHQFANKYQTGNTPLKWNIKSVVIPVYLKYMLNSNKNSILFGGYFSYYLDQKIKTPDTQLQDKYMNTWNTGVVVGFEQSITTDLNIAFKINAGVQELLKSKYGDKKYYPLQAEITISYDLFRPGDCRCR